MNLIFRLGLDILSDFGYFNIMKNKTIIDQVNRIIKTHFTDFKGTYFFGSRLRGDNKKDSDLDLLLCFDRRLEWKEKNLVYDLMAELEIKENIVLDIKVYKESDLKQVWTPFRENVIKGGIFFGAV